MESQLEELLLDHSNNKALLLKKCRDRIEELDEELAQERVSRQSLEQSLKESRRQLAMSREEQEESQQQINTLRMERTDMEQALKNKELRINALKSQLREITQSEELQSGKLRQSDHHVSELVSQFSLLEQQLALKDEQIEKTEKTLDNYSKEIQKLRTENDLLMDRRQSELCQLKEETTRHLHEQTEIHANYNTLKEEIEQKNNRIQALTAENSQLVQLGKELQEYLDMYKQEYHSHLLATKEVQSGLENQLEQTIKALQRQKKTFQKEIKLKEDLYEKLKQEKEIELKNYSQRVEEKQRSLSLVEEKLQEKEREHQANTQDLCEYYNQELKKQQKSIARDLEELEEEHNKEHYLEMCRVDKEKEELYEQLSQTRNIYEEFAREKEEEILQLNSDREKLQSIVGDLEWKLSELGSTFEQDDYQLKLEQERYGIEMQKLREFHAQQLEHYKYLLDVKDSAINEMGRKCEERFKAKILSAYEQVSNLKNKLRSQLWTCEEMLAKTDGQEVIQYLKKIGEAVEKVKFV